MLSLAVSLLSAFAAPAAPDAWELVGHVRTADGVGVAGTQVRVSSEGEALAFAETDAEGRYVLAFESLDRTVSGHFVEAMPRPGWRTKTPTRNFIDLRDIKPAQLDFEAWETPTATLRGRIVDLNGDPLVAFRVYAGQTNGPGELLVTDADGRFASKAEFALDDVGLAVWENRSGPILNPCNFPPRQVKQSLNFDGEEQELVFDVGPSYRLDGAFPADLTAADVRAYLIGSDPTSKSFISRKGPLGLLRRTPDNDLWVRFDGLTATALEGLGPKPWTLRIGTRDYKYGSLTPLPDAEDAHPLGPKLPMVFPDHGAISITVADPFLRKGVRLASPAGRYNIMARVRRADEANWNGSLIRRAVLHPTSSGRATFRWEKLPVGKYAIQLAGNYYPRRNIEIEIGEGGDIRQNHPLKRTPRREWMNVGVTVRCSSGQSPHRFLRWARLASIGNPDYRFDIPRLDAIGGPSGDPYDGDQPHVDRVNADSVELLFRDLPLEEYRLILSAEQYPVDPPEMYIAPGNQRVEVLIRDDGADGGLGFDVRSEAEALPTFRLWTKVDRSPYTGQAFNSGEAAFLRLRQEESWQWSIGAPGYARAYGDRSVFEGDGSEQLTIARVDLKPGWGMRLRAVGPREELLDGVEVRADGELLGTTENGRVDLFRATRPAALAIGYGNWRIIGGHVNRADGSFTEDEFVIHVKLAP